MDLCSEINTNVSKIRKDRSKEVEEEKTPEFTIENNILKGKIIPWNVTPEGLGNCIFRHLQCHPSIVGQINAETEEQYTFAKMRDLSVRCALWLIKHNVKPGDIISILSYNHFDMFIPMFAALFTGAVFTPISYGINTKNVEYYLKLVEPVVIFVSEDSCETVAEAIQNVNSKCQIIVFGNTEGYYHFNSVINNASVEDVENFKCVEISDINETVFILFSSGTTGLSKGVEISHEGFMKSIDHFDNWGGSDIRISLWYSSVAWISGVLHTLNAIIKGATKIFHANFEPNAFCNIVQKYKVTYTVLSPTMLYQLYRANVIHNYNFSHLKTLSVTGAKIRKSVMDYYVSSLPNVSVIQCYVLYST